MNIRFSTPKDSVAIYQLVKQAFKNAEHSDGTEQDLVQRLWTSDSFIPELSLVAEQDKCLLGYILFTRVTIGEDQALALAPLAVLPEFQRQGIGKKLIAAGHHHAKQLGYSHIIVLGDPQYYGKFGYLPASQFNIYPPFEVPDHYFMGIKLDSFAQALEGVVQYDSAFQLES
ncbi:N-acetyltransferase [Avibacterium paragallinarum]|uniref:GNAT family N-acetyltransferase n=1 Tax=Avibacterium paragallinarum TaxID=728 RepID=UPI002EDAE260